MNQKPTKEELRDMIDKGMTLYQISRKYNTTIPEIFQLEKEYGLIPKTSILKKYYTISKEDLESMYINEGMVQERIAEELGYISITPVYNMMKYYNIQTRGRGRFTAQQRSLLYDEIEQRYNNGETIYQIAEEVGYTPQNVSIILQERGVHTRGSTGAVTNQKMSYITANNIQELIDKGLNQHQIAEHFGVCDATIFNMAKKFGIPGMVSNFRHTAPEYQAWKYAVLNKCHRNCQLCGATNVRLEVHHIIPWADAPELRYNVDNGVPLCHECHKKVTGHEYEYAQQFLDITQPQCRDHDIIESMPWQQPLELHSIIDYSEEKGGITP